MKDELDKGISPAQEQWTLAAIFDFHNNPTSKWKSATIAMARSANFRLKKLKNPCPLRKPSLFVRVQSHLGLESAVHSASPSVMKHSFLPRKKEISNSKFDSRRRGRVPLQHFEVFEEARTWQHLICYHRGVVNMWTQRKKGITHVLPNNVVASS